jgi:hypothetical protein
VEKKIGLRGRNWVELLGTIGLSDEGKWIEGGWKSKEVVEEIEEVLGSELLRMTKDAL